MISDELDDDDLAAFRDDFEVFRAAHEGDLGPLIELLVGGADITAQRRELIIKVLRGDISHPPHRQKRITTTERRRSIAAGASRTELGSIGSLRVKPKRTEGLMPPPKTVAPTEVRQDQGKGERKQPSVQDELTTKTPKRKLGSVWREGRYPVPGRPDRHHHFRCVAVDRLPPLRRSA